MGTGWRTVWITGASTGIGRALAVALTERGVRVAASARSADKLAHLAAEYSGIAPLPLDVTDLPAMTQAARSIEGTLGPIDLVVLNAGIGESMHSRNFSAAKASRLMAVNYQGVLNGIEAVLPSMLARRAGHIALMGSVAGYRGVPPGAAYGPTKAAVINLGEALRRDLALSGITISLINPGYVETPMSGANKFEMPYIISAEDAAARIVHGLRKSKFEVAFPWQAVALTKLGRAMPNWLYFWYARHILGPPRRQW